MRQRKPPVWGFFVGLTLVGGLVGFILGEVWLWRGNGPYVGAVFAALGLLLAWMLWRTRPQYTAEEIAAATAERARLQESANAAAQARRQPERGATVKVAKSARTEKGKGAKR